MKRADPETVVEAARNQGYVYDATRTDGVIQVVEQASHSYDYTGWGELIRVHGWYVSGVTRLGSGERIWQLQPLPSVKEIGESES